MSDSSSGRDYNLYVNTSGNCDPAPWHLTRFVLAHETIMNIMTVL
jgi:hypothetical protein